jgi:hypothetical protein
MSAIYPLSVHRRIERQWAERIKSLRQIRGEIVATGRTLQHVLNNDGSLISVPAGTIVGRLDQPRPALSFRTIADHMTQRGAPCDFGDTIAQ